MKDRRNSSGKVVALRGDRNMEVVRRRLHSKAAALMGSQVAPYGWQPLQQVAVPAEATYAGENSRCAVVGWLHANPFVPPGEQGAPMMHLAVQERGRPLIWEEMLQVVREVCGAEAEAVELYPALRRELRGERARHLYSFINGEEWPIGIVPEHEIRRRERTNAAAEKVGEFLKEKAIVFNMPTEEGGKIRVFRDVADAAAAQLEAATLREGLVAAVPEDEHVEWSPAAQAYREEIMKEASEIRDRILREMAQADVDAQAAITPVLQEMTAEQQQAAVEDEEKAAADLEAMRREMIKDGGNL
jgi:hypothetical protein